MRAVMSITWPGEGVNLNLAFIQENILRAGLSQNQDLKHRPKQGARINSKGREKPMEGYRMRG